MLDSIKNSLLLAEKILIVTHDNPDGDALGSSFALKFALESLGKKAEIVLNAPLPVSFEFTGWTPLIFSENLSADCVVGVDFNTISRAGESGKLFDGAETKILIDHHVGCNVDFPLVASRPESAATGEIIYELVSMMTPEIPKSSVEGIYIAIMTDTGGCRYSNTTSKTHIILSHLIEKVDHAYLTRMCLEVMSMEKLELKRFALNNFEFFCNNQICSVTIKREMIKNEDLLNGLVNIALNIEGVRAGVLFKEKDENTIKVSLRTVDLSAREVCSVFSGGGHEKAAGCTINLPLHKAKEAFLKELTERI